MSRPLSVVIPALDAGAALDRCLEALAVGERLIAETVVVDGGSTDATVDLALAHGARVLKTAPGRGGQLARGGEAAIGDWLLFLHADTVLAPSWANEAEIFMATHADREVAAAFRFALDDDAPAARRLERYVAWRNRAFGLAYGDQGLLIAAPFYRRIGGFRAMPLMEDVDLARRIGRGRLRLLTSAALTSAERYRRDGYLRRGARNLACQALYFLGVAPQTLARLYG